MNQYACVEDVAGDAGITGVSTDPFDWGVPPLSFSSLSSLRDVTPSRRTDRRLIARRTAGRGRSHANTPCASAATSASTTRDSQTDTNARGAFVFTGLYASGGRTIGPAADGLDFADFLLGLPQQATVQYGPGNVRMRGKSLSLFVQDDWRRSAS